MATKIVTAWSPVLAREAKPFSHIHCINRSALSNILIQARIIDCKCVPHSPTLFRLKEPTIIILYLSVEGIYTCLAL